MVLLAVHWTRVDEVLAQAGDLAGKVLMTCSVPMSADDSRLVIGHTSSGAEELVAKATGAKVVAAFNNVPSEVLFPVFEARGNASPPDLLYCGDDATAKVAVARLIRDTGVQPAGCRHSTDCALYRAVRAGRCPVGLQRQGWP